MKNTKDVLVYVDTLKRPMGLNDWTFTLKEDADVDTHAQISIAYGQRDATISITHEFYSYSRPTQRAVMVHELVHCHVDMIHAPIKKLTEVLGNIMYESYYASWHYNFERVVDDIAVAWAESLPLPKK